jgi:hypothetical protein
MLTERLRLATEGGTSIILGTVDADGMPAACRGVALHSSADDVSTVTVYIPVDSGQETIANIATTRRIAIVASHPPTHTSVQLKGTTRSVRLARRDEEEFVRSRKAAFAESLELLGVPQRITWSVAHWPAFAVEVVVDEVFEQTPGPNAGVKLR